MPHETLPSAVVAQQGYLGRVRIHRIHGLMSYSYVIEEGDALFLVDAGAVPHGRQVLRRIEQLGRKPDQIALAVVTHGHLDHFGGLVELQRHASFDVGCHPEHVEVLRQGEFLVSPGWSLYGKTYSAVASQVGPRLAIPRIERVTRLADGQRLDAWGLSATALHTPGHSVGCLSVLLDDGSCFVGDLVQGRRVPPVWPVARPNMAVDAAAALASWRKLLEAGAERIYPGHGSVISALELEARLRRAESAS